MAVAFRNFLFTVRIVSFRPWREFTIVSTQTHGPAFALDGALGFHKCNNWIFRTPVEFCTVGSFKSTHVSSKIDDSALQPKAYPQKRHFIFTGKFAGQDLTFRATGTKTSGNQNTIHIGKSFGGIIIIMDFFCIDPLDIYTGIIFNS